MEYVEFENYCSVCEQKFKGAGGFSKHLRYPKNAKCYAIFHNEPWPPVEEAAAPHQEAVESPQQDTAAAQPPTPVATTPQKRQSGEISTIEGGCFDFPVSESPQPIWPNSPDNSSPERVITTRSRAKTRRRVHCRVTRRSSRSRARIPRNQENFNNAREETAEELLVANTNHGDNSDDEAPDYVPNQDNALPDQERQIDTSLWEQFDDYRFDSYKDRLSFAPEMKAAVELMALFSQRRVPLNLYEDVFHWHLGNLDADKFITRKSMMKNLRERYNMVKSQPTKLTNLRLPFSGSRINLVIQDARYQIQSLLTDPRICDDDYLFFDDNPFASPPLDREFVGDINTGRAYTETHLQMIEDPDKQILLPIMFYMDGAVTGQFDNLPIEALKISLGIFNRKARNRACCWREVGYMTKYVEANSKAEALLLDADHIDAKMYVNNKENAEGPADDTNNVYEKGQDMHFMLEKMLEPYKQLQDAGGFSWKLRYKGETYDVEFIPFILFVKGDGVECDKHCGHYTSRMEGVRQLCRYCTIPNEETDNPWKRYDRKSPQMIHPLVLEEELEALKAISQQCIDNTWYKLKFGLHNDLGIHGAAPIDVLHWLNIGKFGYTRNNLFDQLGKDSKLQKAFNTVCTSVGMLMSRQSNRDMPRTQFTKGVQAGKMTGHEMSGVLLTIAGAFRTQEGRTKLRVLAQGDKALNFNPAGIKLWAELIERQLQFEAWLNRDELSIEEVKLLDVKIRDLMQMEKDVGHRTEGMGFRTWNFHATSHVAEDILDFGVPENMNTSSNESHHIPTKTAAKRTQRQAATFDEQCGNQIHNMLAIDFAMTEITEDRCVWKYLERLADTLRQAQSEITDEEIQDDNQYDQITGEVLYEAPKVVDNNTILLGGTMVELWQNEDNLPEYKVISRMKNRQKFKYHTDFVRAAHGILQARCLPYGIDTLQIYTEHKRQGQIFRGSPYFMGKQWMDWVMADFGDDGIFPCQIWGFVDLRHLPVEDDEQEPAICAIVESLNEVKTPSEANLSRLFVPYTKQIKENNDGTWERSFWICDVESFLEPTTVIPDIGNIDDTAYLRLKPRHEWADDFGEWLHRPALRRKFPSVL